MNPSSKLPKEIKGKWIWDSRTSGHDCQHLLFRNDFLLSEMAGEAELWVATHAFFNIFVNGRCCMGGPVPNPGRKHSAYAVKVDIAHLLEVGYNHIAICVHKENTFLSGINSTEDALWMQLNVDGAPMIWSDRAGWISKPATAYKDTGLLTAPCDVFTEEIDFAEYSEGWMDTPVRKLQELERDSASGWRAPDDVHDISLTFCSLEPYQQPLLTTERRQYADIINAGSFEAGCQSASLSLSQAIPNMEIPGTYIAETYIWCDNSIEEDALFICDSPYILYVNGSAQKRQAVPRLIYRGPTASLRSGCLQPQDYELPGFSLSLSSGWNHLMVVVECQLHKTGFTFLFPTLQSGTLHLYQKRQRQSSAGWTLTGPLNTPMVLVYPEMDTSDLFKYAFEEDARYPFDPAAFYYSCHFTPNEAVSQDYPIHLNKGNYLIFDFGAVKYAQPFLQLRGNSGDVVDVVCGEHLRDGDVLALIPGERRNVTTLKLKQGSNEWFASTPCGFRYVMVTLRQTDSQITIENAGLWHETLDVQDAGEFSCSSPVLEQIWETGCRTMQTTMRHIYMDSPTGDQAQSLPDAMIQSFSAYYAFGLYSMAENAIESFARGQFETGELNAMSPSPLFQALPDYSLCWPVWLHRHYLHSGNRDFLMKMMPNLLKLMEYYNAIASKEGGYLKDLQDYLGVYPFIDYGDFERRGISCALNGLYCRALLSTSWLADMADMQEFAAKYRDRASRVATKVSSLLWNEEKQLFADSYIDGRQTDECSWQSNVLAIYGGIARPAQYETIWQKLFSNEVPMEQRVRPENNNPYFQYYVLETAYALGKSQWALRFIHYYWGSMIKAGARTWWETFDPGIDYSSSFITMKHCSGYGVTPNAVLIRDLIGIRPAEPGMNMVYFNPTPGDVTWAKALIPTPRGSISVFWKLDDDGTFNVNISATYNLEVIPILEPGIAQQAVFNVTDKVSIMAPDEE